MVETRGERGGRKVKGWLVGFSQLGKGEGGVRYPVEGRKKFI